MTKSDNYTSYYDQKGKPRLLTISAAEPFDLEAYHWTFPVLGSVSYKGYFNRKRADREILDLRMKGYDVDLYYPSGWSTLGWFKDPVLSGMLKREEHDLADLIIHELTHGTLYVKSSVTFNENLANFIGDKGAEKFLLSRFGPRSKEYRQYKRSKSDEKVYSTYMLAASYRLDSLYMHLNASHLSVEEKKAAKTKLLTDISIKVMKLPLFQKKKYFKYSLQSFREGNAFFMSFRRYDSQYDIFDNEFRRNYNSDLRPYLEALKQRYPDV
jgi:predicted aminopeptidase